MWISFFIFTAVSILFYIIGVVSWKAKEPVGFFTGIKPPKVKDTKAFNHAVAKIWFVFATLFELLGIPLLWISEDSTYGIFLALLVMFWTFGLIITYLIVEQKYKV